MKHHKQLQTVTHRLIQSAHVIPVPAHLLRCASCSYLGRGSCIQWQMASRLWVCILSQVSTSTATYTLQRNPPPAWNLVALPVTLCFVNSAVEVCILSITLDTPVPSLLGEQPTNEKRRVLSMPRMRARSSFNAGPDMLRWEGWVCISSRVVHAEMHHHHRCMQICIQSRIAAGKACVSNTCRDA